MATRILVVDDSATVRKVVERALLEAGYEVVLAADGQEAIARLEASSALLASKAKRSATDLEPSGTPGPE